MLSNALRKLFGNTEIYRFCAWLNDEYHASSRRQYRPEQFKYFGKSVRIAKDVQINHPKRVILKEGACIAAGAHINSEGGLYVGRYTGIGFNCIIWTVEHHYYNAKTIPFDNGVDLKPVIIRDFVWIGANVKIFPGKEIGEGAILGMGSVITTDVPPLAIVIGNPARIVGHRSKEHFEKCKNGECFSTALIGDRYVERMFPLYKRKFKAEIEELGLANL